MCGHVPNEICDTQSFTERVITTASSTPGSIPTMDIFLIIILLIFLAKKLSYFTDAKD